MGGPYIASATCASSPETALGDAAQREQALPTVRGIMGD